MRPEELDQLQRYERMIAAALDRAGGLPARRSVIAVIEQADTVSRGEYRGLTVYSWLMQSSPSSVGQAFVPVSPPTLPRPQVSPERKIRGERQTRMSVLQGTGGESPSANNALQAWCRAVAAQIGASPLAADQLLASDGHRITETVWLTMALHASGERDFARSAVLRPLITAQKPNGTFLKPSRNDNLESLWYHELVLLHAVASYGVVESDPTARDAVFRATEYHLDETQPDHATNDPWGLFAFLWNPRTRPLADGMLHTVSTMGSSRSPVTLMLLADALYCVRRLLATNQDKL